MSNILNITITEICVESYSVVSLFQDKLRDYRNRIPFEILVLKKYGLTSSSHEHPWKDSAMNIFEHITGLAQKVMKLNLFVSWFSNKLRDYQNRILLEILVL